MRYFSALIGTGCALLSLPVDGRFSTARAQHRSVNTMNERQLSERLTVTPIVVLVDVRLAPERAEWTIQCERCTVVSAPCDFKNDAGP